MALEGISIFSSLNTPNVDVLVVATDQDEAFIFYPLVVFFHIEVEAQDFRPIQLVLKRILSIINKLAELGEDGGR